MQSEHRSRSSWAALAFGSSWAALTLVTSTMSTACTGGDGAPDGGPGVDASRPLDAWRDHDAVVDPGADADRPDVGNDAFVVYTGPRPSTPRIREPEVDGQLVSGADVHMETAPFEHEDAEREHLCTDWEIWSVSPAERVWSSSCIGGVERLHAHLGDGEMEGARAGLRGLAPDVDHVLRARHRDDSGTPEGEWSEYAERTFRTRPERAPLPGAPDWLVLQDGFVVEEVAGGFRLPVNIAFAPSPAPADDEPFFYVTELYGNVRVVTGDLTVHDFATDLLDWEPSGVFPGSGEQGLTGIVVDPTNGDVYVSMLIGVEGHHPRVVRLESTDGGLTASSQTIVLDMGMELQGASHQISTLTIGPDRRLYVNMGDGFDIPSALSLDAFRGKILRVELDGTAPSDNPFYDAADGITARDYIFAYGFRNPFGGAWRRSDMGLYSVENGPAIDRLTHVTRGTSYGWDGEEASIRIGAIHVWERPCAPVNITFIEATRFHGSGFPETSFGHAFVSESGPTYALGPQELGKRISEIAIAEGGLSASAPVPLVEYNGTGASTVAALATGPDGLYFSDLYAEDPSMGPTAVGAHVYRVRYDPAAAAE